MKAIYQIKNLKNNKVYIGSTADINKRWKRGHLERLRNSQHHNRFLQFAWNRDGEEFFEFSIIEEMERTEDLLIREQFYLDKIRPYDKKNGYNICKSAAAPMQGRKTSAETKKKLSMALKGRPSPMKGRKHSDETKKKMSEARSRNSSWNKGIPTPDSVKQKISNSLRGRPSPMKGRKHSDETKKLWSEQRSGENNVNTVLTWELVNEIRKKYRDENISQRELAKQYGVSRGCICGIIRGTTWKNLQKEEY